MPLRILIVENEELIALDLQDIVEGAGHTVVGRAASQAEAVRLARKAKPTVALVDMELDDGANGLDVAVALHEAAGTLPLFITGRSDFLIRAMALDFEPLGYITKPYKADEVLAALVT